MAKPTITDLLTSLKDEINKLQTECSDLRSVVQCLRKERWCELAATAIVGLATLVFICWFGYSIIHRQLSWLQISALVALTLMSLITFSLVLRTLRRR